ncbi:MAG: hypothetical protein DRJ01_01540 [Bacteroidetes bacterium]|nr:MAG: hypothetical protein DRJ01_01540 [Bacteroidota bacterium]
MDKKNLLKNINKDIKEIEIIVKSFDNNSEIHQIDIDITLSKLRNLYDKFLMFNNIKNTFEEKQETLVKPEIRNEEKTKKKDYIDKSEKTKKIIVKRTKEITNDNIEDFTVQPQKIKQEVIEKKKEIKDEEPNEIIAKDDKKTTDKKKSEKNIIADSFKTKQKSINEKIAEKNKLKDLATKLQGKPVSDINKIISLNEKIQFIKILFNGDSLLYKKTIDALNSFDKFEMAIEFINQNFDWDKNDKYYINFIELISRRFQ